MQKTIVWFRHDLRLQDHPALYTACLKGSVLPIYILDDHTAGRWKHGSAMRWWLHHSLDSLKNDLQHIGLPLLIYKGNTLEILADIISKTEADALFFNRHYEPFARTLEKTIEQLLAPKSIEINAFPQSTLLFEPENLKNKQGSFFKVFTPFWRHCLSQEEPSLPLPAPKKSHSFGQDLVHHSFNDLALLPTINWTEGLKQTFTVSEKAAHERLQNFLDHTIDHYDQARDIPSTHGTSLLSPYLNMGQISPRTIWHAVKRYELAHHASRHTVRFLTEIGWREFSHHLLYHFPQLPEQPFKTEFRHFPWKQNSVRLKAWQQGRTGYPIIDAGMRQLWHTGYMHNRVRMIVASFLTKHLLIHWQHGQDWFWDTLVDANLANNSASWQWVAGSGADAAPYFRIFNPILQGQRFDPQGTYVKQWLPELEKLASGYIHMPWKSDLCPSSYPQPIIMHNNGREQALEAYRHMQGKPSQ